MPMPLARAAAACTLPLAAARTPFLGSRSGSTPPVVSASGSVNPAVVSAGGTADSGSTGVAHGFNGGTADSGSTGVAHGFNGYPVSSTSDNPCADMEVVKLASGATYCQEAGTGPAPKAKPAPVEESALGMFLSFDGLYFREFADPVHVHARDEIQEIVRRGVHDLLVPMMEHAEKQPNTDVTADEISNGQPNQQNAVHSSGQGSGAAAKKSSPSSSSSSSANGVRSSAVTDEASSTSPPKSSSTPANSASEARSSRVPQPKNRGLMRGALLNAMPTLPTVALSLTTAPGSPVVPPRSVLASPSSRVAAHSSVASSRPYGSVGSMSDADAALRESVHERAKLDRDVMKDDADGEYRIFLEFTEVPGYPPRLGMNIKCVGSKITPDNVKKLEREFETNQEFYRPNWEGHLNHLLSRAKLVVWDSPPQTHIMGEATDSVIRNFVAQCSQQVSSLVHYFRGHTPLTSLGWTLENSCGEFNSIVTFENEHAIAGNKLHSPQDVARCKIFSEQVLKAYETCHAEQACEITELAAPCATLCFERFGEDDPECQSPV